MKALLKLTVALTVLALAAGSALAQTSNFWNNPTGVQDWNTAGNWSAGSVPTNQTTYVLFTNKAASAYTVQFSNVSTSGTLRVTNDKTTLDIKGYKWRVTSTGYYSPGSASPWISYGVGETSTVVFSSSAAPAVTGGNTFDIASDVYDGMGIGAGATVRIDDSLGYPVNMKVPYNIFDAGSLTVGGPGVTLYALTAQGSVGGVGSSALIERGAILSNGFGQVAGGGFLTVNGATMVEPSFTVGGIGAGRWILTNNAKAVVSGGITVGYNNGYGTLTANGSSIYGQTLAIGSGPSYAAAGNVTIENGALLSLSNGVSTLLVTTYWQQPGITNFLTLNNATIRLGGSGGNGLLSNASIMKATGTITGQGAGNFLLLNDAGGQLTIGNSPGVLTVNKGNVQLATNSKTFFQFSDTAVSKLVVTNGFVSMLGSNVFSLANGAPAPVHGVKYGLGVYDFVVSPTITNSPQYDNLVNLLTNTYHLTYGVDFQYGVVNLGGGLFALELTFVPEPSTVLLLALGGLLVWRRLAKRGRKTGKAAGAVMAGALILALAGGSALAQYNTNYWINPSGTNPWSTGGNWSSGTAVSSNYMHVGFTNRAASAYTVQLTGVTTSGTVRVTTDKVTFDVNGYKWFAPAYGYDYGGSVDYLSHQFGINAGETSTVTFSSSQGSLVSGGNAVDLGFNYYAGATVGALSTLNIDDSLGYGVAVTAPYNFFVYQGGKVNLSGSNSVLRYYTGQGGVNGTETIRNGALWEITGGGPGITYGGTMTLTNNGALRSSGAVLGAVGWAGTLKAQDNSKWYSYGAIQVGYNNGFGQLLVDNSTVYGQNLQIGSGPSYVGNGLVTVQNGGVLILSNATSSLLITTYANGVNYGAGYVTTNTLVLNNATIRLGGTGGNGLLSNASIVKATGTITGQGSGNFLLLNDAGGQLTIGNSPGVLTVNKGNVQLATNSKTFFQFSDTAVSKLVVTNGFVSMLGSNVFSLASGAPQPVPGVKYGLGVYDFVIGSTITNSPQYDNLVNLLTNTYHLTYGVDFQYGVVNLGGGLFALELTFVPEPSTLLLLALGGLMVWRRIAKGRRKTARASAIIVGALILALAGGSALAAPSTNYWINGVSGVWNWSTPGNWDTATVPFTTNNSVIFTNRAASAYTVQFTGYSTSGVVRVTTDKITFDLNGNLWYSPDLKGMGADYGGSTNGMSHVFAGVAGETCTVTFSSSAAGSNTFNMYSTEQHATLFGNGARVSTFLITTNLGYGALVITAPNGGIYNPKFTIEGPGSELRNPAPNIQGITGDILVRDGGYLNWGGGTTIGGYVSMASTMTVNNAKLRINGVTTFGSGYQGVLILTNNSTFASGGDLNVGYNITYAPNDFHGTLRSYGSQIYSAGGLRIGDGSVNGQVYLMDGSTTALSNGWVWIRSNIYHPGGGGYYTNTLVMNNAALNLGRSGVSCWITNQGIMRASGTITGNNSTNFLLRNENVFEVGNSIGTLTLNKGNFEAASNSKTYFEFSQTGSDLIRATNGWVHLLGTNLFSLASGASSPVPGVKYGLGVYDFVITTNNNISTPQYDNLVTLLTNTYHLTYGVDFQYGVVNLGGGLFALELTFVPEPSTVLLLALGGLMVWRRMAKRPVASRK